MKHIIRLITGILAISSVFWACKESFLESTPQNGIFTDLTVFKNVTDFDSYIFGAYTELQDVNGYSAIVIPGYISQDLVAVDEKPKVLGSYLIAGNGSIGGYWSRYYKVVGRSNEILDRLTVAPKAVVDSAGIRIEGEAKFLRGYAYFCLARAFGNIPMPLASYTEAQNSLTCTPESQIWDQVIKDLTDASVKLPRRAGWGSANLGRATRGSALAYLVNAYMYKKDWTNATKASTDLIALGDYKLLPDVRQVFSVKNENTDESIFETQYRVIDNGNYVWSGQPNNGNYLNQSTAPRNLGDTYAPYGGWGEAIMNLKLVAAFEPGDQRRNKLVKTLGETYQGELMSKPVTIPTTIAQANSGFSAKYWLGPADTYLGGQNLPQMRYAEFLLNYAEILFEQGKTADAYTHVNAVRQRVGLATLPAQADREVFLTALMKERRAELNFEPNLWFHYTRTGRAVQFLKTEYGLTVSNSVNKFPIPQGERDQNPKLCQNEGY